MAKLNTKLNTGAIAETCSHLKALAAPYIPHMLPILAAGLQVIRRRILTYVI
jgi:hypothetical protein